MFRNREDAARQLAEALRGREWIDPLVLAIPRGGAVVGAKLARELGADFDIVLARKLRAPDCPEVALGAVSEFGDVYLHPSVDAAGPWLHEYLANERAWQLAEIARRQQLYRKVRPAAQVVGRSVIVTDDGIATGATMSAALQVVRAQRPHTLFLAVPVAAPQSWHELSQLYDDALCLYLPSDFQAVGQFYEDFTPVDDAEVVDLLRAFTPRSQPHIIVQS